VILLGPFAAVILAFLLLGSLVFVAAVSVPRMRRYALSAALWCAMWGPTLVALVLIGGAGLVAGSSFENGGHYESIHASKLLTVVGWTYVIAGLSGTALIATIAARLHQAIVRRFTFALFRLYATAVSAGIGSVFGWALGATLLFTNIASPVWLLWTLWMLTMVALVILFGTVAYKGARSLRGDAPTMFTPITQAGFEGL